MIRVTRDPWSARRAHPASTPSTVPASGPVAQVGPDGDANPVWVPVADLTPIKSREAGGTSPPSTRPNGTDRRGDWWQTLGREPSPVSGVLVVALVFGLLLMVGGGQHLYVAWTEGCHVGTEFQRCTEGQGKVTFGIGLGITVTSTIGLLVTALRRR